MPGGLSRDQLAIDHILESIKLDLGLPRLT